ncbi:MAG: hypothetical protein HOQ01_03025 [Lysobacter sp.]|nr:hypothetical protein [Lysobacter sp.]
MAAALFVVFGAIAFAPTSTLAWFAFMSVSLLPGFSRVTLAMHSMMAGIGLPTTIAAATGHAVAVALWAVGFYWLGRWFASLVLQQRSRGRRVALVLRVFLSIAIPIGLYFGLALLMAAIFNYKPPPPDPAIARAQEAAEAAEYAQRVAEVKRLREIERQERARADEARRQLAETRAKQEEVGRFIAQKEKERADAAAAKTGASRPLADDERCVDGQRLRRVDNGWVQAGVCSNGSARK